MQEVVTVCEGKYYNSTKPDCERALSKVDEDVAGINMYNILEACYHGDISSKISLGKSNLPASFRKLGETERPLPVRTRMFGRAWPFRAPVKPGYVPSWPELLNGAPVVVGPNWILISK
ncbi:putative carboxypeptidase C [Helianthus anomalus]